MNFIEAFQEEKKCWHWAAMPAGAEAVVLAFCFCLFCRMQGIEVWPVKQAKKRKAPR